MPNRIYGVNGSDINSIDIPIDDDIIEALRKL